MIWAHFLTSNVEKCAQVRKETGRQAGSYVASRGHPAIRTGRHESLYIRGPCRFYSTRWALISCRRWRGRRRSRDARWEGR
jgi:hypothetical protein